MLASVCIARCLSVSASTADIDRDIERGGRTIRESRALCAAMDAPFFHELRRQASSYLTGKIRSARLALTDVTPTQL